MTARSTQLVEMVVMAAVAVVGAAFYLGVIFDDPRNDEVLSFFLLSLQMQSSKEVALSAYSYQSPQSLLARSTGFLLFACGFLRSMSLYYGDAVLSANRLTSLFVLFAMFYLWLEAFCFETLPVLAMLPFFFVFSSAILTEYARPSQAASHVRAKEE